MRLGEVGHRLFALWHYEILRNRLRRPLVRIPHGKRDLGSWNLQPTKDLEYVYSLVNVLKDNSHGCRVPWIVGSFVGTAAFGRLPGEARLSPRVPEPANSIIL